MARRALEVPWIFWSKMNGRKKIIFVRLERLETILFSKNKFDFPSVYNAPCSKTQKKSHLSDKDSDRNKSPTAAVEICTEGSGSDHVALCVDWIKLNVVSTPNFLNTMFL